MADDVQVQFGAETEGALAGIEQVTHALQQFGSGLQAPIAAIKELGEALLVAFAVEKIKQFFEAIAELGAEVEHMTHTLGLGAEEISAFNYAAEAMGVSAQSADMSLSRLERNMVMAQRGTGSAAAAFRAMGISTEELKEHSNDLQFVLNRMADFFSETADGANKTAIAFAAGGRAFGRMIPIFDQGREGLRAFQEEAGRTGTILTGEMAEGMEGTSLKLHELDESFKGIKITIFEALKPAFDLVVSGITDFIESANRAMHGATILADALHAVVVAVDLVIAGFTTMSAIIQAQWQIVAGVVTSMILAFQTLATVMYDVLSGSWGKIGADVDRGLALIQHEVEERVAAMKNVWLDFDATMAKIGTDMNKAMFGAGPHSHSPEPAAGKPEAPAMDASKGKSSDEMTLWREQLQEKIRLEIGFFKDSTNLDVQFWQGKLSALHSGTKEYTEVSKALYDALKKQATEAETEELAVISREMALKKKDLGAQLDLENEKLAILKRDYGTDSKEYQNALNEKLLMERRFHDQQVAMLLDARANTTTLRKLDIEAERQALDQELADGKISAQQKFEVLKNLANEEYQLDLKALTDRLRLADLDVAEQQKVNDQILILKRQHELQMQQLNVQSVAAQRAQWGAFFGSLTSSFNQVLNGMLQGTQTWRQALGTILQNLAVTFIQSMEAKTEKYLESLLVEDAATEASATVKAAANEESNIAAIAGFIVRAVKVIASYAAETFAGVFAFLSGIMGPAAAGPAAASAAVVLGSTALLSAAGGFVLPNDSIVQAHKNEMILPAGLSKGLQDLVMGRQNQGTQGNTTINYNVNAIDAAGVRDFFNRHGRTLTAGIVKMQRDNLNLRPR